MFLQFLETVWNITLFYHKNECFKIYWDKVNCISKAILLHSANKIYLFNFLLHLSNFQMRCCTSKSKLCPSSCFVVFLFKYFLTIFFKLFLRTGCCQFGRQDFVSYILAFIYFIFMLEFKFIQK